MTRRHVLFPTLGLAAWIYAACTASSSVARRQPLLLALAHRRDAQAEAAAGEGRRKFGRYTHVGPKTAGFVSLNNVNNSSGGEQ